MKRPNVLLMYTDQQRWDSLGCLGNPLARTPNLDALADGGAAFDHCFVNCPVCMPSRMSLLSGRYPASLGIATNGIAMPDDIPCLQHLLGGHGYHTANFGKLHFRNHSDRDHREPHPPCGFDTLVLSDEPGCYDDAYIRWVAEQAPDQVADCRCQVPPAWRGPQLDAPPREVHEPYLFAGFEELTHTAFVADETCDFLRRQNGSQPFFAIAGFYAPHAPINPPARFVEWFAEEAMPLPRRAPGENFRDVGDQQWRRIKAYYYALVSHIDDQVGRILTTLDQQGLAEDTIVIFTSDHGENLGDHGQIGKGNPHDSSSRVPLLVRWPGRIPAGQRQTGIVEAVDLSATVLDCCALQIPPFFQGQSLREALLSGADAPGRDSAFIELRFPLVGGYKAIRTREHLYVRHDGPPGTAPRRKQREQLFCLADDPHQLQDRAADPARAADLAHLRDRMLGRWFDLESQYPLRTADY